MAQVSISINGRTYQIACDDGQEDHVSRLGAYVNEKIAGLVASVGQIGDAQLLVMANLLIADELSEAYEELKSAQAASGGDASPAREASVPELDIDSLARRIETIAERLEQA